MECATTWRASIPEHRARCRPKRQQDSFGGLARWRGAPGSPPSPPPSSPSPRCRSRPRRGVLGDIRVPRSRPALARRRSAPAIMAGGREVTFVPGFRAQASIERSFPRRRATARCRDGPRKTRSSSSGPGTVPRFRNGTGRDVRRSPHHRRATTGTPDTRGGRHSSRPTARRRLTTGAGARPPMFGRPRAATTAGIPSCSGFCSTGSPSPEAPTSFITTNMIRAMRSGVVMPTDWLATTPNCGPSSIRSTRRSRPSGRTRAIPDTCRPAYPASGARPAAPRCPPGRRGRRPYCIPIL